MNPVLLKPQSEIGAQIVVQGRVYGSAKAAAYQHMKHDLLPYVLDSFEKLRREALELAEKQLGPEDKQLAPLLGDLAFSLHFEARDAEA